MRWAEPGAAYVPFIGEGDLAVELFSDRKVYGADLDPERLETASERLPRCQVKVADCDGWPFPRLREPIAIADFDAYVNPYHGFRAFWAEAPKRDRLVLYFTDGIKQAILRKGIYSRFDGTVENIPEVEVNRKREVYYGYLSKFVWPAFEDFIKPWRMVDKMRYLRHHITYWGAVIERA